MPRLTEMRKRILQFIVDFDQQYGYAPTIRTIANEFNKSPSTIHFHIRKLIRIGFLERNGRGHLKVVDVE